VFIDVNLAAKTARELIPWLIAKVLIVRTNNFFSLLERTLALKPEF